MRGYDKLTHDKLTYGFAGSKYHQSLLLHKEFLANMLPLPSTFQIVTFHHRTGKCDSRMFSSIELRNQLRDELPIYETTAYSASAKAILRRLEGV